VENVTILPFRGVTPLIDPTAFIAPGCHIIGDVRIGADASIWYNNVIRGDIGQITIGARTNIQDGTIIHVTGGKYDTQIGADCLIGHIAMIHGCKLHDRAFVGMGAIVMDDCEIEPTGMLAAGAMLTPGKRIGSGQMWAGRPAKYVRDLSEEEMAAHRAGVAHYVENGRAHALALAAVQSS
jgi:carbonic anhydrase/acetyltransferase-like protein (isoleucine patch superfamily)